MLVFGDAATNFMGAAVNGDVHYFCLTLFKLF
jgi:hypothetical protein